MMTDKSVEITALFDDDLTLIQSEDDRRIPKDLSSKLAVDTFYNLLASPDIEDVELSYFHDGSSSISGTTNYYISLSREDASVKLHFVTSSMIKHPETQKPAYVADLEIKYLSAGLGAGFSLVKPEDYEAVRDKTVEVSRQLLSKKDL
jgi:hypothetical protein